ncbi:HmuY family protein [Sphingobacterium spiritivorum]|nr:HmuY family protein [Sphingobacterium spiritivorum]
MMNKFRYAIICFTAVILWTGCSKSNDGPNVELSDGTSTVITDLAGDVDASVGNSAPGKEKRDFHTFLFRLSDQKQTWLKTAADSAKYIKGTDWDIAFSGLYNSTLYVNNGQLNGNPAAGNTSRHKVILVKESYDRVNTAPSDADFDKSQLNDFGMIGNEDSQGWYNYNLTNHLVAVVPNRTYVIRLTNGKYAKLQIVNIYKGNPPAVTDLNWPAPYFTFKYFVQEDGSKNLKTK